MDRTPRLRMVRLCIVLQKATVACAYAAFLVLFLSLRGHQDAGSWMLFALITILSAALNLATVSHPRLPVTVFGGVDVPALLLGSA